jgi:hypothetical protein
MNGQNKCDHEFSLHVVIESYADIMNHKHKSLAIVGILASVLSVSACGSGPSAPSADSRIDPNSAMYKNGMDTGNVMKQINASGPAVKGSGTLSFALDSCQKLASVFLTGNSKYENSPTNEINSIAGCLTGLGWQDSDARLPNG